MKYVITTPRLGLRRWKESDLPLVIAMNQDKEVMLYFPSTLSAEESLEFFLRIQRQIEDLGFGLWAVEKLDSKEYIGFTGFSIPAFESFFTPCVEIGWRLRKEYWGRGYATEAALASLTHGFEKWEWDRIVSFTSVFNLPSERVMQKIGMTKQGEFEHPSLPNGHRLCRHLLYEIRRDQAIGKNEIYSGFNSIDLGRVHE